MGSPCVCLVVCLLVCVQNVHLKQKLEASIDRGERLAKRLSEVTVHATHRATTHTNASMTVGAIHRQRWAGGRIVAWCNVSDEWGAWECTQ